MAKHQHMMFPRFIDRPRLFMMFEIDEVVYSILIGVGVSGFMLLASGKAFYFLITMLVTVPLVFTVVREAKKRTGLPGALSTLMYAAGYTQNFNGKKEHLIARYPELKRMGDWEFLPQGIEDEFYS